MRSSNLILATSYALLVDAAPAPIPAPDGLFVPRDDVSLPSCDGLASQLQWSTATAPWISDANNPGAPFCASLFHSGHRIVEIDAFKEGSGKCDGTGAMTRLEVKFSDPDGHNSWIAIGSNNKACPAGKMVLADDEIITNVNSWKAGGRPNAQGKTQIMTNKDNHDFWLKDEYNKKDYGNPWTQEVKSGVLIGLTGYMADGAINQINFQFLPGKVSKLYMTNFDYDQNDLNGIHIDKKPIFTQSFTNGDPDHDATFSLDKSTKVSHSVHNEHETIDTMGFSISLTEGVEVPDIAKVDSTQEFQWSQSHRDLKTTDDFDSTEVSWNMGGTVGSLMTTDCVVYSGSATGIIHYTARQYMDFDGGAPSYWYPITGYIDATDLVGTSGSTVCTPRPMNSTDVVSPSGVLSPIPKQSTMSSSVIQTSTMASSTSDNAPQSTEASTSASAEPTQEPTSASAEPTQEPTSASAEPTQEPTSASAEPTQEPTSASAEPTQEPTSASAEPTQEPTSASAEPTQEPTSTSASQKAESSASTKHSTLTSASQKSESTASTKQSTSTSASQKSESSASTKQSTSTTASQKSESTASTKATTSTSQKAESTTSTKAITSTSQKPESTTSTKATTSTSEKTSMTSTETSKTTTKTTQTPKTSTTTTQKTKTKTTAKPTTKKAKPTKLITGDAESTDDSTDDDDQSNDPAADDQSTE